MGYVDNELFHHIILRICLDCHLFDFESSLIDMTLTGLKFVGCQISIRQTKFFDRWEKLAFPSPDFHNMVEKGFENHKCTTQLWKT